MATAGLCLSIKFEVKIWMNLHSLVIICALSRIRGMDNSTFYDWRNAPANFAPTNFHVSCVLAWSTSSYVYCLPNQMSFVSFLFLCGSDYFKSFHLLAKKSKICFILSLVLLFLFSQILNDRGWQDEQITLAKIHNVLLLIVVGKHINCWLLIWCPCVANNRWTFSGMISFTRSWGQWVFVQDHVRLVHWTCHKSAHNGLPWRIDRDQHVIVILERACSILQFVDSSSDMRTANQSFMNTLKSISILHGLRLSTTISQRQI